MVAKFVCNKSDYYKKKIIRNKHNRSLTERDSGLYIGEKVSNTKDHNAGITELKSQSGPHSIGDCFI